MAYVRKTPAKWTLAVLEGKKQGKQDKTSLPKLLVASPGASHGSSMPLTVVSSPENPEHVEEEAQGEPEAGVEEQKYFYGWDNNQSDIQRRAWRQDGEGGPKEYCEQVMVGASDMDPIKATFADGSVVEIGKVLTASFKAMIESKGKKEEKEKDKAQRSVVHFSSQMQDGAPIVVKQRRDGKDKAGAPKILTSLYVFNKQKCMLKQGGQISEELSIQVMTDLAKKLEQGKITIDGLFNERDQMVKALGVDAKPQKQMPEGGGVTRPRKRPAACAAAPPSPKRPCSSDHSDDFPSPVAVALPPIPPSLF